ncbi:MAG: GxxExxY protein [Pseudomonadota bacterium]
MGGEGKLKPLNTLNTRKDLCDEHRAQLHNYLKASGLKLGFLVYFGGQKGSGLNS